MLSTSNLRHQLNEVRKFGAEQYWYESRYFATADPVFPDYTCGAGLPAERRVSWDFRELGWWSRIYEYRWMWDVARGFFGDRIAETSALDAGSGIKYPGCFLLAEAGFARVVAQDRRPRHEMLEQVGLPNLVYRSLDLCDEIEGQADLVACISVLEHIEPDRQAVALRNMCHAVAPRGLLALTVDMPGFEYDTDLALYERILEEEGFRFLKGDDPGPDRLNSRTGPIPNPGWPKFGRLELQCYRLLAWQDAS